VFALGCVYSLAAPWLAQRAEAKATTLSAFAHAHSYDPLNTQIITDEAAFAPTLRAAQRYYRDAITLEPTNAAVWLELTTFYAENHAWELAYKALSKAYRYDPKGPAGQCGLAHQIRRKVGVRATCRGAGLPPIP
jgi:cytochrome c-type biogenesis protein CcmH/NrfG